MMYQSSEHAVAIETLKADYENVLERTSNELKVKHEGEIALGKTLDLGFILKVTMELKLRNKNIVLMWATIHKWPPTEDVQIGSFLREVVVYLRFQC